MKSIKIIFFVSLYLLIYELCNYLIFNHIIFQIQSFIIGIIIALLAPIIFVLPILFYRKKFFKFGYFNFRKFIFPLLLVLLYSILRSFVYFKMNEFLTFELNSLKNIFSFNYILIYLIYGPFVEEILYRGIVIEFMLEEKLNKYLIIITTSLLFAFSHYNFGFFGVINALILGIILSLTYLKYRNLIYCVLLHLIFNLLAGIFIFQ